MVKEKHRFLLRQRIREPRAPDGKIIALEQEFELEVNWSEQYPSRGEIERQIIEFEKDGKIYKFSIEAKIKKGWFKDHAWSRSIRMDGKESMVALQTRTTGWFYLGGFIILCVIGIGSYLF